MLASKPTVAASLSVPMLPVDPSYFKVTVCSTADPSGLTTITKFNTSSASLRFAVAVSVIVVSSVGSTTVPSVAIIVSSLDVHVITDSCNPPSVGNVNLSSVAIVVGKSISFKSAKAFSLSVSSTITTSSSLPIKNCPLLNQPT